MKPPFPYFGKKTDVTEVVWKTFNTVDNYIEPFAGSCAMLLARPEHTVYNKKNEYDWGIETINDADGLVSNFWRATAHDVHEVARHAAWIVHEADLHARHLWLVNHKDDIEEKLMADPDWYDPKAAGWWLWGACNWIGQGWCRGDGPWYNENGTFVKGDPPTYGVNRQIPHIGGKGRGINKYDENTVPGIEQVLQHIKPLALRMSNVRIGCGDWSRVTGKAVRQYGNNTAIFLDPPYSEGSVDYAEGSRSIAEQVCDWAIEVSKSEPDLKIALCGYEGEHDRLVHNHGWDVYKWGTSGGYGVQGHGQGRINANRERIWFSPACEYGTKTLDDCVDEEGGMDVEDLFNVGGAD